jgi:hypothetical protein
MNEHGRTLQLDTRDETSALDVVRTARMELEMMYGPCAASNTRLMHVTSRRLIEESTSEPAAGTRLMNEVRELLGT